MTYTEITALIAHAKSVYRHADIARAVESLCDALTLVAADAKMYEQGMNQNATRAYEIMHELDAAKAEIARLRSGQALLQTQFTSVANQRDEWKSAAVRAVNHALNPDTGETPEPVAWRRIEEIDRETDGYVYYGKPIEGGEPLYASEFARQASAAGPHGYFKPLKPDTGEKP